MLNEFRFIQRFRVPFRDVDMLGHVNNAAYVAWTETIRCEYIEEVLGDHINGERGWIMASQAIEYVAPIAYRDDVAVGCRIARFGGKSLEAAYEIWSETAGRLACRATNVLVAYDYAAQRSIAIPAAWRERAVAFEVRPPEGA